MNPAPSVLVVDDDYVIRRTLADIFRYYGFECCEAESAATALGLAQAREFSVALVDVQMPGGDGFEVTQFLSHPLVGRSATPVWMMTGAWSETASRQAEGAGARRLLAKPFRVTELMEEIKEHLAGQLTGPVCAR